MSMSLREQFNLDSGSVIVRLHVDKNMNNQDNYSHIITDSFISVVVCDGCSASPHSEVGSYITSRYMVQQLWGRFGSYALYGKLPNKEDLRDMMEEIRLDTSTFLRNIASSLGPTMLAMQEFALSTATGFVMTPDSTFFFSIGDGMIFFNGEGAELNNRHASQPDMVAYGAMNPKLLITGVRNPFTLSPIYPTETVENIIVATDGLEHLLAAAGQNYPSTQGSKVEIPSLEELLTMSGRLQDVLRLAGKTVYRAQYDKELDVATQTVHKSPLLDDITAVILRRKQCNRP